MNYIITCLIEMYLGMMTSHCVASSVDIQCRKTSFTVLLLVLLQSTMLLLVYMSGVAASLDKLCVAVKQDSTSTCIS